MHGDVIDEYFGNKEIATRMIEGIDFSFMVIRMMAMSPKLFLPMVLLMNYKTMQYFGW